MTSLRTVSIQRDGTRSTIDLFTDTAAILDSIVLANTLWDAQGANDPKNCTVLQCGVMPI